MELRLCLDYILSLPEKLPIKIGKIFSTLFEKRHSGDYDDFVYCDKEMLDNLYPQAELFIHTINQLLKEE